MKNLCADFVGRMWSSFNVPWFTIERVLCMVGIDHSKKISVRECGSFMFADLGGAYLMKSPHLFVHKTRRYRYVDQSSLEKG